MADKEDVLRFPKFTLQYVTQHLLMLSLLICSETLHEIINVFISDFKISCKRRYRHWFATPPEDREGFIIITVLIHAVLFPHRHLSKVILPG